MLEKPIETVSVFNNKISGKYTQYTDGVGTSSPTIRTKSVLESGIYKISVNPYTGVADFQIQNISTDELLRFNDPRYNSVLEEIDRFWGITDKFKNMGFTHKRGLLLYGPAGSGKSCLLKLVMENIVSSGDIVFMCQEMPSLITGLKQFREVEPDRKVLVIMEDLDEICRYGEHQFLELFDGPNQMGGVLYLGTTNYIDRLPPRVLRASRLDRKIKIDHPAVEGRLAYLNKKLEGKEDSSKIEEIANKTNGFSFGQLRELLVSVYCLDYELDKSIKRLKDNLEESRRSTDSELDCMLVRKFKNNKLSKSDKLIAIVESC